MAPRYALRRDNIGWTVFDTFENQPAIVDGARLEALPQAGAEVIASLLNWSICPPGGKPSEQ
jgi:hypothetical protein